MERENVMPAVEKELNVIPIEDAMAVSRNEEKRTLLLEQLKKDIGENYKTMLAAAKDSDSETAHYVAAAKMEIYRRKQAEMRVYRKAWEEEPENGEKLCRYLRELDGYIKSGLLAEKEAALYKREYCRILAERRKQGGEDLTAQEYGGMLTYLAELKREKEAEEIWEQLSEENRNEAAYRTMLRIYYDQGKKDAFYHCLESLQTSDVTLSPEGLKILRYWKEREV